MINKPETIGRNTCIKTEKGSGKLQPGVLLEKKKKSQTPKGLVRVQSWHVEECGSWVPINYMKDINEHNYCYEQFAPNSTFIQNNFRCCLCGQWIGLRFIFLKRLINLSLLIFWGVDIYGAF